VGARAGQGFALPAAGERGRRRQQVVGLLAIAPAVVLILSLALYPVGYSIWLSLLEKHSFFPQERFVGLENYRYLSSDEEFWSSLWLGSVYSLWTIVLQIVLGVTAALILNETFRGRNLVRGIVLFPYMIPTIVAVILWKWLLNDTYGVVNYVLVALGIVREPISWLGTDYIMLSLILMSVWQFFPFVLLAILARLQTIPEELYEAAKVDGATPLRRFVHVTLPQIRGILFVVILLRSIWMFTKFDTVWLMGEGAGAGRFIRTLPVYAYMRTFTYYQAGLGAALAVIMFAILMASTVIYFGLFKDEADIG
jgi:multiple sugar transport system permease protein